MKIQPHRRKRWPKFKKALELRPDSVREQLNYGLALLRDAKTQQAVAILQKVQKEDPKLPHTWFNLGIYYKRDGQFDKAMRAVAGDGQAGTFRSHYSLQPGLYLQSSRTRPIWQGKNLRLARDSEPEPGRAAFPAVQYLSSGRTHGYGECKSWRLFRERKQAQENDAIPKEDVEWCEYAEIYEPLVPESDAQKRPVAFSFRSSTLGDVPDGPSGIITLDAFGTGGADLLVYSGSGIDLYKGGTQKVSQTGLDGLRDVVSVDAGDFNNDGLARSLHPDWFRRCSL